MWRRVAKSAEGVQQLPNSSVQMGPAYQSFDFPLSLECHRVVSLSKARAVETHLDTERVRFLRAGLVTPLPGGLGIDPAGIMTGARGASLWVRSMVRGTPAPSRSHEARPGLSRGINLRGKHRSGAPRGERARSAFR